MISPRKTGWGWTSIAGRDRGAVRQIMFCVSLKHLLERQEMYSAKLLLVVANIAKTTCNRILYKN